MRQIVRMLIIAPALVVASACSKDKPAADSTLNTDLGLAAQNNSARLDSITAAERLNSNTGVAPVGTAPALTTPAPVVHRSTASAPARRSTSTRRSSGSSSGSTSGSSSGTVAAEPRTEIHKNTKRDAAIGAAAGAVLGGVVGKGGVKGAVIGGVAGGILGGVIGNNVDVQKKRVP